VFYNGTEPDYQDKDVFELKLSDAFNDKEGCVEFKAKVYNVNYGHNAKLMNACKALSGYAQFIAKIRRYNAEYPLEEAVDKAVSECIKDGILADILTEHKAEVKGMVLTEYNEAETMKSFFNDGRNEGVKEGGNTMLYELVRDGDIKISVAAKKAGVSIEKFETNMLAAGYKLPLS
jgi:hypothetical protein